MYTESQTHLSPSCFPGSSAVKSTACSKCPPSYLFWLRSQAASCPHASCCGVPRPCCCFQGCLSGPCPLASQRRAARPFAAASPGYKASCLSASPRPCFPPYRCLRGCCRCPRGPASLGAEGSALWDVREGHGALGGGGKLLQAAPGLPGALLRCPLWAFCCLAAVGQAQQLSAAGTQPVTAGAGSRGS